MASLAAFGQVADSWPLWVVFLGTAALSLLAVEVGYRLGKLWQRRAHTDKDSSIGFMVSATLGLLAFMLAFIIGIAVNRFDARRGLVVEEANAIGTTWLRAGFLAEPLRAESRALLSEYVDWRVTALDPNQFDAARLRSEAIHVELWARAETAAAADPTPITALYVDALNQLIDTHTKRLVIVTGSRIPASIWLDLYVISTLTMVLVGLQSSFSEQRNWLGIILLVVVFAAVMSLIVDLDRPLEGLFSVSQQALLDLQAQLGATTP